MSASRPLSIRPRWLPHLGAIGLFSLLALWMMLPVLARLETALPGAHLGDNATALWNVWWFLQAAEHSQPLYRTSSLFAPFGTQLSLHTHATTHSLLAWPLTKLTSIVASHNLAITAGLALNGICAWLLAYRTTGSFLPSAVAGVLFSLCAFVQVHLLGHINLVHAWVLPLFALALARLTEAPRAANAVLVGIALALVAYTDYYLAVYAGVLGLTWLTVAAVSIRVRRSADRFHRLRWILLALIALDLLVITIILATGGTALDLRFATISLRGVRNPLTAFWFLLAAWALCRFPFTVSAGWRRSGPRRGDLALGALAAAVCAVLAAPLWLALIEVAAAGDYTTQRIFWRSSPAGADAATLILGHPRHLFTGSWTAAGYSALRIDATEQVLWLGIVPLVLLVARRRAWLQRPGARAWLVIGTLFAVLSLGPFLRIGGLDTGLPLPHAILRYVPVISNARIPGRAVVVVHLAIAVMTALALAGKSRRRQASALLALLLVAETLPAPVPAQAIPIADTVDEALRTSPVRGAVAELPLGIRDGFGQSGELDHRALIHQLWHGRPLVGGFVARLPERVRLKYRETPLLENILAISTPSMTDAGLNTGAAAQAAELGIAFIVVNRDTFVDDRLPREVLTRSGFELVQAAGPRELYAAVRRH